MHARCTILHDMWCCCVCYNGLYALYEQAMSVPFISLLIWFAIYILINFLLLVLRFTKSSTHHSMRLFKTVVLRNTHYYVSVNYIAMLLLCPPCKTQNMSSQTSIVIMISLLCFLNLLSMWRCWGHGSLPNHQQTDHHCAGLYVIVNNYLYLLLVEWTAWHDICAAV